MNNLIRFLAKFPPDPAGSVADASHLQVHRPRLRGRDDERHDRHPRVRVPLQIGQLRRPGLLHHSRSLLILCSLFILALVPRLTCLRNLHCELQASSVGSYVRSRHNTMSRFSPQLSIPKLEEQIISFWLPFRNFMAGPKVGSFVLK